MGVLPYQWPVNLEVPEQAIRQKESACTIGQVTVDWEVLSWGFMYSRLRWIESTFVTHRRSMTNLVLAPESCLPSSRSRV